MLTCSQHAIYVHARINTKRTLDKEGNPRCVLPMSVQGFAGVISLISWVHCREGQYAASYHGSGTHSVPWTSCKGGIFVYQLVNFTQLCSALEIIQQDTETPVIPIHSMAGVGFPVTVQRNSARWPCWTFSTDGAMVATGWAPSAATGGDTSVKHNSKWRVRRLRGRWRSKAR